MPVSKVTHEQNGISTALAAVALQDHLVRSLRLQGHLSPQSRVSNSTSSTSSSSSVARCRRSSKTVRKPPSADHSVEQEYVLGRPPPLPTLAQRLGLVDAPPSPLSEDQWQGVKDKAKRRHDFQQPCVICKEELGTQAHVLLSCTHVFHKSCLNAFERFTGRKTCPMCRAEHYQTRLVHDGKFHFLNKCATLVQAAWRGYVVRCMYRNLRQLVPPRDQRLRKIFFEEKLKSITDRMLKSYQTDVDGFCSAIDRDLEANRKLLRCFDDVFVKQTTDEEWKDIVNKALQRNDSDCSICLNSLHVQYSAVQDQCPVAALRPDSVKPTSRSKTVKPVEMKSNRTNPPKSTVSLVPVENRSRVQQRERVDGATTTQVDTTTKTGVRPLHTRKAVVVLSCSHIFHKICLDALEQFATAETKFACPICRSFYKKKILDDILD